MSIMSSLPPITHEPVGSWSPYPKDADPDRPLRVLRKYWNICRISLIERLTYRADFFLATILRFLPMLTTILLWEAVFAGAYQTSGQRQLSGFSLNEMI